MARSFASLPKMESSHISYSTIIKSLNRGESFTQWQYGDHKTASFKRHFPAKFPGVGEWVNLLHVPYTIIVTGTLKDNHTLKKLAWYNNISFTCSLRKPHNIAKKQSRKKSHYQMTVFTSCPALKTFPYPTQ